MKKSALMLLIILLPLAVKAQTPYRNEDGKKIDKEELETKDYLPEIHGTIRTKFEYQTEMAASRFEVRNARISITVIITQCLGAGARSAAADIKHSLSWWGISQITVFTGKLVSDIVWEKLAGKKRAELTGRMNRLSKKLAAEDFGKTPGVSAVTKIKFLFCRMMQKSLHENDPEYTDGKYWAQQGWLSGKRPW